MRALISLVALACLLASAVALDSAEQSQALADSASRLRQKIARAQRVLAEIQRRRAAEAANAEAEVGDANAVTAALKKSFVIGDVGSSGTRLQVYVVDGNDKASACAKPCAEEAQGAPTNLDLISANVDPSAKAVELVNMMYTQCVAKIRANANNVFTALALTEEADIKAWLAQVPMYYEATAGLRMAAQSIERKHPGETIKSRLWDRFRAADTAWRAAAKQAVANPLKALISDGARPTLLARVIPGALEGWYGFRAGASVASAKFGHDVDPKQLIYIEVGGASQQIVFTIPRQGKRQPVVPTAEPRFAQVDVSATAEATTDEEAIEQLSSRLDLDAETESETEGLMSADADMSIQDMSAGPMELKITGKLPQHGLLYSKSFLGNGMNRFTTAVVREALTDPHTLDCTKAAHGTAWETKHCVDMPCWRQEAAVLTSVVPNQPAPTEPFVWGKAGPDTKVLQDLTGPLLESWIKPAASPPEFSRVLQGTNDVAKCEILARRVWAGFDDHDQPYRYEQQFREVRAALALANASPEHRKTHVMINTRTIMAGDAWPEKDHPQVMSMEELELYLGAVYGERALSQFTYNSPLVSAYFSTILFDAPGHPDRIGTFDLGRFCRTCKFGVWAPSWSIGAADFFVAFGKETNEAKKAEYSNWEFAVKSAREPPAVHPDIEDPYHNVCAEAFGPEFSGYRSEAKALCEKNPDCQLRIGGLNGDRITSNQALRCPNYANKPMPKTACVCARK